VGEDCQWERTVSGRGLQVGEEGCAYSFKRAVAHAEQLLVHINVMYLGERSPGGDVAGVSPVLVETWPG
jgi:hypothetical protein